MNCSAIPSPPRGAMRPLILLIALLLLVSGRDAFSAETDHFTVKGQVILDSLAVVNRMINESVAKAIERANAPGLGCSTKHLYGELRRDFHNHTRSKLIELISESPEVARIVLPNSESIYRDWKPWNGLVLALPILKGGKLGLGQIININGTHVGVDKLEHLFSTGWKYFREHNHKNKPIEEVLAISGYRVERGILGGWRIATGVVSFADLSANFNGIRFWNDMLGLQPDILGIRTAPFLACEAENWVVKNPIDISNYVDASFDESVNCSAISTSSGVKKVRAALDNLGMSCPVSAEHTASLNDKYGWYADFVLNFEGIKLAESKKDYYLKANFQPEWRPIPEMFSNSFADSRFQQLEYKANSRFEKSFRYSSHKRSSNGRSRKFIRVRADKILLSADAPEPIRECWKIFVTGGDCEKPRFDPLPHSLSPQGNIDLLSHARDVSRMNGLYEARRYLLEELSRRDASNGELRERVMKTTSDKGFTYPDSIATIPHDERARIGFYFLLGISGAEGLNTALILKAASGVAKLGFTAEMLPVSPKKGSVHNARLLAGLLPERMESVDRVVFVTASKGAADLITFMLDHADSLSAEQRDKVRMVVAASGVIRSSIIAGYVRESNSPLPFLVRNKLRLEGRNVLGSLARDPWTGKDRGAIARLFRNLKWLNFPAVPEGELGFTGQDDRDLSKRAFRWSALASPTDGLVESAASVLPPDTGITEFIIPTLGPHSMALGSYSPDLRVSPVQQKGEFLEINPEAGDEILDSFLRAFPKLLLH